MEKKEASLKKMLATVLKDKEKIEETIEELDRYKRDALQKTWEKVNGCVNNLCRPIIVVNDVGIVISEEFSRSSFLEISQSYSHRKGKT